MSPRSLSLAASAAVLFAASAAILSSPASAAAARSAVAPLHATTGAAPATAARPASDPPQVPVTKPCVGVPGGWTCRLLHGPQTPTPAPGPASRGTVSPRIGGSPPYGPSDLWSAYSLGDPRLAGGNLVALVEAFDDPALISDINTYRTTFGLGGCVSRSSTTCTFANGATVRKIDQQGGTNIPFANAGFAEETALDSEMIAATCPSCSIVVVEAADNTEQNVVAAMQQAVAQNPAEISLSLGRDNETAADPQEDRQFFEHGGIATTVAAGDCGFGVGFPASSPGVISVGGTKLSAGGGTRGWTETVWGGSGALCDPTNPARGSQGTAAGCSAYQPKPAWQTDTGCAHRTINDVAAVADPSTGVQVVINGLFVKDGGTSASAPIIAGMIGVIGGAPYTTGAGFLYADYNKNHGAFNDITSGVDYAGAIAPLACLASPYLCTGVPAYDGPTGLGTPQGFFAPPPLPPQGYWMVAGDGGIFPFGNALARSYGSTGGIRLNQPIVGMARTHSGNGYWLVATDGGVFPFGDATLHSYGSTGNIRLNKPIVGMAATPDGGGYWLVASDGGMFPFGDAGGFGSTGGILLNQPIAGMAVTVSGGGYWLVASDGGIFPFGDATQHSYGSTGGIRLNKPIVTMAATPSGNGYWLFASDGGVFPFGDALGLGSTGNIRLNQPMVNAAASAASCGC